MSVIAKKILRDSWGKYTDSEQQLKSWYKEASKADWKIPKEFKEQYAKSSILKTEKLFLIFVVININ